MITECEEWKDIEEFKGLYQVSNLGRVKRLHSTTKALIRNCTRSEKILKPCLENGSLVILLRKNGRKYKRSVGKLVLLSFVGPPPKEAMQVKYFAKHIDGDVTNNKLSNLQWGIRQSFYEPTNERARQLFSESVYDLMLKWSHKRNLANFRLGMFDIDDLFQIAALRIYKDIDGWDESLCDFLSFVFIRCDNVFKTVYKSEKNKVGFIKSLDEMMENSNRF